MPICVDYAIGMLARNMLIWALFRYIHPEEIKIDYLDLLVTKDSIAFMSAFLCPCGGTILNYCLHFNNLRRKNEENAEHKWLFDAHIKFVMAVKGR